MREVAGFPGYLVSPCGDVYSTRQGYPRKLIARPHKGYLHVQIKSGIGKATQRKVPVHQVVLFAYGPPRPSPLHGGRHLNGDATNNHHTNLAWGTQAQNIQDAIDHGTHVCVRQSERIGSRRLTDDDVNDLRAATSDAEVAIISSKRGVTLEYAKQISRGFYRAATTQGGF